MRLINLRRMPSRWSIAKIMYVSFILMIVLPVTLITYFSTEYFRSVLLKSLTSRAMQTLEQVSYTVDSQVKRIITTIASVSHDTNVMSNATLLHRTGSSTERFQLGQALDKQLSSYFHYTSDVVAVDLLFKNSGVYSYKNDLNVDEQDLRKQPWYMQTLQQKNKVQFFGVEESKQVTRNSSPVITAAISPQNSGDYDIDMMYFTFQASTIQNLLQTNIADSGSIIILDQNNKIITSSQSLETDREWLELPPFQQAKNSSTGYYTAKIHHQENYIIYQTSNMGWKYIQVIPYAQFNQQLDVVVRRIVFVTIIGLFIFLIISVLVVHHVVKPILGLVKQMNMVKRGRLEANIKVAGPVEMYVLSATFNEMVIRIKELLTEVEMKEKAKKQAEITALQSQINPHFLLNTLNTIKVMAIVSKTDNIRSVAESLTKLLSAAFNRGGDYTTIAEELVLLEYYVNIMKIRYGDHFDVAFQFDSRLMNDRILKLLLQPMIENAIIHGLQGLDYRGRITVTGSKLDDSKISIVIQDNGSGISLPNEEDGDIHIALGKERFSGMGLRNVNQRIQLNYGEEYGVSITSELDEGTMVTIILPMLDE